MARRLSLAAALALALSSAQAPAQTAPGAAEIAAYRGLHAAAAAGDGAEIRRLVTARAELDARDGNGRTPLHVATFRGHAEAARLLIAAGAQPGLLDDQRYDAVTIASVRDDEPMLKALIASGASAALVTSRYDGTALIAAAHLGHDGVVRELIRAGAPLDHVNNLGWTALMEAVVLGDGGPRHVETVRALVTAGADRRIADRQGVTPLQHAKARGYGAIAALLE
ncbi:ankyrin repeat domain-containing protein [Bosea sp. BK604]|uniref:ankyrin repeat domain-containing protein n=1 Tax=Bosea sp. BK604 TaxID=2512180 RepID=UPI001044CB08|nr:ankyrin repeat domain-containing protein [Bosea sp. BK604]TCR63634.1 hypothetical protein EV560_108281 [Bosea sp. BK604]